MEKENPETSVLHREEVYSGKIVNLIVDTVMLPSGNSAIREVVQHPGGVTVVPVMEDGRILLIRQFRYPLGKYILELPAGKLDTGQSPFATIMRELEEEAGYRAGNWTAAGGFYTSPGISDEYIHLFIARGLEPAAQRLEEGEHITVETFTRDECLRMIASGGIEDGKTILGILAFLMKIY